ncbi:Ras guanine nucleotide exchange factor bud5 [Binucleata daphniae]
MIYKISDFINELLEKIDEHDQPAQKPPKLPHKITSPKPDLSFEPSIPARPEPFVPNVWSEKVIPHSRLLTKYLENKNKTKHKAKIELSQMLKFKNCKPKVIAKELTNLDKILYVKIHPDELVEYNGSFDNIDKCQSIYNLQKKNDLLSNLVFEEIKRNYNIIKFFIKVCQKLESTQNYNSLIAILCGIKRHKLEQTYFDIVSKMYDRSRNYFELRKAIEKSQNTCVIPIDMMLKDVEESNTNRQSEIAAKRFCDMIEYLVKAQEQTKVKVKRIYEHFLRWKLATSNPEAHVKIEEKEVKRELGSIFLFL